LLPTPDDRLIFKTEYLEPVNPWDASNRIELARAGANESTLPKPQASTISGQVAGLLNDWQVYHFHDTSESAPDKQNELDQIVKSCGSPELINDGYETCPNRRLKGVFPSFNKKLDGPEICKEIGLAQLRMGCPRFDTWITQLEAIVV
jgi:hypothetical protein